MKRIFDCIISLVLIFIFFPFFIIIPFFIKIDSIGSVFFVQKRMGYEGKEFKIYKFRSMKYDVNPLENNNGLVILGEKIKLYKHADISAITSVGRILRRCSLDELPQLFNVIKGQMSLVGPRPFMPSEELRKDPLFQKRLSMFPGISGLPQIKGRGNLRVYDWLLLDSEYIDNWSFGYDLKIMLLTIPAVLKKKGAY